MSKITKITEHLYVGNSQSARDTTLLKAHGITACVNVAKDLSDPWIDGVKSYKVGLVDGESSDNEHGYTLATLVVTHLIKNKEKVLVHCHEGRSRSVAICVLVLSVISYVVASMCTSNNIPSDRELLEKTYNLVKNARPQSSIKDAHWKYMELSLKELSWLNQLERKGKEE